jgi:precorrin-6Y C5,15-methyltransferase (decarboxylating) CbiT subunit
MTKQPFCITAGIPDSEFIRGDVPMTKQAIRVLSLSKLWLTEGDNVLDIGAGTGSVSVEIARLLPQSKVFAVEHKQQAVALIIQNAHKFETPNIQVISGKAPQALAPLTDINKVFIGGSGGNLRDIIDWVATHTPCGTRLVINAVTLDTLVVARDCLVEPAFDRPEIIQVAVNRIEKVGNTDMFRPESPVYIISTTRL